MKKQVGIWLDTDKAVLVSLMDGREEVCTIESNVESRLRFPGEKKPTSRFGTIAANALSTTTNRKKQQLHHYFNTIIKTVEDAADLYLIGPSTTKIMLEKEIRKHSEFSHRPLVVEPADKMTHRQLVAHIKNHFHNNA
jgi:hypothetical protein